MALALVSVLAAAAVASTAVYARARNRLRQRLAAAGGETDRLGRQVAKLTAERDELAGKVDWLTGANARITEDAARHRERADALEARLAAASSGEPGAAAGPSADLWDLLLAHVTRRWAAVVGVPPGSRGLVEGGTPDQLAQALDREVERLREEVGVDVELTVSGPVEPRDGALLLLAAVELLGALAASAERVRVDLDGRLVLAGEGWSDQSGELAAARDRAVAAGARVTTVDAGTDRVRLEVSA